METAVCFVVGLVAAGLAFAAVEAGFRLWYMRPGGAFVWAPHRRLTFRHDRKVLPGADAVARIEINAHGERGAPPPKSWHGVYRVLVMGASAAECIALDQENTWPEVMRRTISQNDPMAILGADAVHVGNIGKSLLPASAQVVILDKIKARYRKLDLLVIMVGASDFISWLEEGAPEGRGAKPLSLRRIFDRSSADLGWDLRHLAIYRSLSIFYNRVFRPIRVLDAYTKRIVSRRLRRKNAKAMIDTAPNDEGMLGQLERELSRLLQQGKLIADRVILVRHPWLDKSADVDATMWIGSVGTPVDSPEPGCYLKPAPLCTLMEHVDATCHRVALEQGVEHVEVRGRIPADFDHYVDRFHFGVRGARVVGEAVAAQIIQGAVLRATKKGLDPAG